MENSCQNDTDMDLHTIWIQFCSERDQESKIRLAQLFLFKYHLFKSQQEENEPLGFLSSVPSQLSCYLLQLVYDIICTVVSSRNADGSDDSEIEIGQQSNCSFDDISSTLILNAPSDITAILSLREFLVNGLGRLILEFLHDCDTQLITCKRELGSLLINLFPSSGWDNTDAETFQPNTPMHFREYLKHISLIKCLGGKIDNYKSTKISQWPSEIVPHQLNTIDKFTEFSGRRISSDQHAFILIDILLQLVQTETGQNLDEKSVTLESLQFALDTIIALRDNSPFDPANYEIIKFKILSLAISCLENIFVKEKNLELAGPEKIVSKLLNALIVDGENYEDLILKDYQISSSLITGYLFFGFLYNSLAMIHNNREDSIKRIVDALNANEYRGLLNYLKQLIANLNVTRMSDFKEIVDIVLLTLNISRTPYSMDNSTKRRLKRKTRNKLKQNHIHCKGLTLSCILDNVLIKILRSIDFRLQNIVISNFEKNGICCCTFSVENVTLIITGQQISEIEKHIYKFLSKHVMGSLFSNDNCLQCKNTSQSAIFQKELVVLYIEKHQSITKSQELMHFLKHISKITYNTTNKISEGVLTAIALPIFHSEMQKEIHNKNSIKVILACLRIFRNCLVDSRLMTIFFIDEIINYLRELMLVPDLVQSVCALLNIGLNDNINGDMDDRKMLCSQLNSIIMDANLQASALLDNIFVRMIDSNQVSCMRISQETTRKDTSNMYYNYLKEGKLNVSQLLTLAVTYWDLTFELFYRNNYFKLEFIEKFPWLELADTTSTTTKLSLFICNTLSCLLNHNMKTTQSSSMVESVSIESIPRNNTTLTLSDYCVVSLDDILNDDSSHFINMQATSSFCSYRDNSDDQLNADLFSLLSTSHGSNDYSDRTPLSLNTTDSDSTSESFNEIADFMTISGYTHNEFVSCLKINENGDKIFDIRNQNRSNAVVNKCYENVMVTRINESKINSGHSLFSSLYKLNSILTKSVSYMFTHNYTNSNENDKNETIFSSCCDIDFISDDKLKCLQGASNCKRKLLKMFTSALATMILDYNRRKDRNMQLLIRQLRNLLLPYSKNLWDNVENANSIIYVLQALLKVAEMTAGSSDDEYSERFQSKFSKSSCDSSQDTLVNEPLYDTSNASVPSDGESNEQFESEIDDSDEETDEATLVGTDEGYEADAEIVELSDTSHDEKDLFRRYNPSLQYRASIVNEGLCNLVVETLMELSVQCIKKPECWVTNLTQLLKQLQTVRDQLGGTLFLLRGFAKILSENDTRLKDLQQVILDLICDLNDPDCLAAYLNILASDHPPIELLVQHMTHICINSINVSPYTALEFPVKNESPLMLSETPYENIKQMRNLHEIQDIDSIFTRSPCFLPISTDNVKPFEEDGFTISTWIQICKNPDNIRLQKNCEETHIISFGTQQLIISLFVNEDSNLIVEFYNPTADISSKRTTPDSKSTSPTHHNQFPMQEFNQNHGKLCQLRRKRKLETSGISNIAKNSTANRERRYEGSSALKNVLQSTTLAIFNSFSSFNLLQNASGHGGLHGARIESDSIRLQDNKWTHLCISIQRQKKTLNLTVILDGTVSYPFELPWTTTGSSAKRNFDMIAIGDMYPKDLNQLCNGHEFVKYRLASIFAFKRFLSSNILANLTTLGPECKHLVYCQAGNNIPNYGLINYHLYSSLDLQPIHEALKLLRCHLVLSYSMYEPNFCTYYSSGESGPDTSGRRQEAMLCKNIVPITIPSLQNATYICGGLSCLLILFARTVELTSKPEIQANVLNILLRVALTDVRLYTEFIKKDTLNLIGSVIKTNQCSKSVQLLKVLLNNACSFPICAQKNGEIQLTENMDACIVYPNIIVNIVKRCSDWSSADSTDSTVLDLLLHCIQDLIHEKQLHQAYNMSQFLRTGLVKELLNLCKVYLVESPNPVYFSKISAALFVDILNTFAGAPPPPSLLDEITKLLLILQKPNECYVTDNRSRFYFLLTSEIPTRQRRIGLQLPTKQLRFAIRNRKKLFTISDGQFQSRGEMKLVKSEHSTNRRPTSPRYNRLDHFMYDVETLQSITKCSPINSRKLCAISKENSERFRKFLVDLKKKQRLQSQFQRNQMKKIMKRKSRKISSSNTDNSARAQQNNSENADDEASGVREFDIVNSDEISSLEDGHSGNSKGYLKLTRTDVYHSHGVIAIQDGLFDLLRDYLLILPDSSIDEVLTHYVKLEIILVLANNKNCKIRTSILRLLIVLCDRLPPNEIQNATKKLYWYHLANQLALHPVDNQLIETCIQWVTRKPCFSISFEELNEREMKIHNKIGLNAMLAMAAQTVHNTSLAENVFKVIEFIYRKDSAHNVLMIESGIIQSSVKALQKMYLEMKSDYRKAEDSIKELLTTIAEKSVSSNGHINILWELLNILSYYGESSFTKVVYGFRTIQAHILCSLVQLFLQQTVNVGQNVNLKNMHLPGSTLSTSEVRTRFDLIIDRSTQFFICMSNSYHPSGIEVQLFEQLITLSVSGYSRCSCLIAWGLSPNQVLTFKNCVTSILLTLLEQSVNLPTFSCDWKMIRAFLWKYQSLSGINGDCSPVTKVCKKLMVTENDVWSLEECIDKLELNRASCLSEMKPIIEKAVYKFESIAQSCTDTSMSITRIVADLQNSERKHLMILMRQYDESFIYAEWKLVIQRMTHEGAPWHCPNLYPKSWELDDTEGPQRIRTRLRRCALRIPPKFIMPDYQETYTKNQLKHIPFKYLIASHDQQINFSLNAQILFNFPAKFLPVDGEIDGELIVTDEKIYFAATHRFEFFYINSFIDNITEIWIRRYQHQENAFEFFINSNKSFFFVVENVDDRNMLKEIFADKIVINVDPIKLMHQWKEGRLTNWEYLMALNQLAGRTYNDLMQYPVFPWILADYKSNSLDLTTKSSFRKLEKPIAVQYEDSEQHYINNFSYMSSSVTNLGSWQIKPYHYSSHYSNSGTVLHFLVRIPPYTNYFLRYQDNNFDIPDRTFHSLNTTWNLASKDSPTDVKELIPEFFCLPEMFENFENFNFGTRQNGENVNHVSLPPWSSNNPRLFVLIHRQALESEMVRKHLHCWIDLIFGYKQTGQPAIDAINVFHPATYAEFEFTNISDPIERQAFHTMIKTYGQMPKQLFRSPHDTSTELNYSPHQPSVLTSVKGLRWGIFTGSPQLEDPKICSIYKQSNLPYTKLLPFENKNIVYGLYEKSCIMLGTESEYSLVSWHHDDHIVRIQALNENVHAAKPLLYDDPADLISCCGSNCMSNVLWFGHKSGKITVYHCTNHDMGKNNKSRPTNTGIKLSYNSAFRKISSKLPTRLEEYEYLKDNKTCKYDLGTVHWSGPTILVRHTDEVASICISMEFKIAVSIAKDGLAVIWDLNSLNYIRTIERPSEIRHSPLNIVVVSPTLGDIFTIHSIESSAVGDRKESDVDEECFEVTEENLDDFVNVTMNFNGMSIMRLHSVNGKYISHNIQEERILSACYSYIKEGVGVNVIATGFENGILKLWSSWDLSLIREIIVSQSDIISLTFSTYQHLSVLTKDYIQVWDSSGLLGDVPKFPQFTIHKGSNA